MATILHTDHNSYILLAALAEHDYSDSSPQPPPQGSEISLLLRTSSRPPLLDQSDLAELPRPFGGFSIVGLLDPPVTRFSHRCGPALVAQ